MRFWRRCTITPTREVWSCYLSTMVLVSKYHVQISHWFGLNLQLWNNFPCTSSIQEVVIIMQQNRKVGRLRCIGCKWGGGYSEILKSETTTREISKWRRERREEERGRRKKRAGKWHRATGREGKAGFHAWLPASVGQPRQLSAADDYRPSLQRKVFANRTVEFLKRTCFVEENVQSSGICIRKCITMIVYLFLNS